MRTSKSVARKQAPDLRLRVDQMQTLRRLTGWSTAELARRMGMDLSAVSRLLSGRLQLGRHSIAGLLVALRGQFGDHVCLCGLFDLVDADGSSVHLGADLGSTVEEDIEEDAAVAP